MEGGVHADYGRGDSMIIAIYRLGYGKVLDDGLLNRLEV